MSGLLQALAVWVGLSVLTAPFAGRYMRDVRERMEADRAAHLGDTDADWANDPTPLHDALWCEQREDDFR